MAASRSKREITRINYKTKCSKKPQKISWSTSIYFPIEILDEAVVNNIQQVLVHYVDWEDKYNEWKSLGEMLTIPNEYIFSTPEGTSLLYLQLAITITENLHVQPKTDSMGSDSAEGII